jgi:phosphopantetheinyl transferase (holo-ACP synthase)
MSRPNFLSPQEILLFQKTLAVNALHLSLRQDWGSQNQNHREQIHHALQIEFNADMTSQNLHTTTQVQQNGTTCSISHCPQLGGFATITSPWKIGMDVEQQDRVSIAVANRVCRDPSECDQVPSPSALWTAKEAAFKSLRGPQQPTTISQLVIGSWKQIDSHLFTFELKNFLEFQIQKGLGITYSKDSFQIALFICQNAVCR